jgi:hypothetical protein
MADKRPAFDWLTLVWAALVPAYSILVALVPASHWLGKLLYVAGSIAWTLMIAFLIKRKQREDEAGRRERAEERRGNVDAHAQTHEKIEGVASQVQEVQDALRLWRADKESGFTLPSGSTQTAFVTATTALGTSSMVLPTGPMPLQQMATILDQWARQDSATAHLVQRKPLVPPSEHGKS